MQFEINADVISNQGDKVGVVDRVVIDPKTKEVTHLVIHDSQSGKTKVAALKFVGGDAEGHLVLRQKTKDFSHFPVFEETHFIRVDESEAPGQENSLYWYPPLLAWGQTGRYAELPRAPYVRQTEKNIPEELIALTDGAAVFSREGERIGQLESIRSAPDNRATHLVISGGLLLKTYKLVPTHWINEIRPDEIHLAVGASLLNRLPEYQPES